MLPVLLLVLALGVWVLGCVSAQLRCTDAAAMGARAAARGDPAAEVLATARSVAPAGATVTVHRSPDRVRVVVRATVSPFGELAGLGQLVVSGSGTALREDVLP